MLDVWRTPRDKRTVSELNEYEKSERRRLLGKFLLKDIDICCFEGQLFTNVLEACDQPCLTCGYEKNSPFWVNAWIEEKEEKETTDCILCIYNGNLCLNCSQSWVDSRFIHDKAMNIIKEFGYHPEVELQLMKLAYECGLLIDKYTRKDLEIV